MEIRKKKRKKVKKMTYEVMARCILRELERFINIDLNFEAMYINAIESALRDCEDMKLNIEEKMAAHILEEMDRFINIDYNFKDLYINAICRVLRDIENYQKR